MITWSVYTKLIDLWLYSEIYCLTYAHVS